MAIQWPGRAEVDDLELTSTLGRRETTASDWAFDAELNRHMYRGDARAFVQTLTTLEHESLYVGDFRGLDLIRVERARRCGRTAGSRV